MYKFSQAIEKLSITKKEPLNEALYLNGASKGTELENNCIRFAQLSLHESELITNIKVWLCT